MYRRLCNILFADRSLSQLAIHVEIKIKFDEFTLHTPLRDYDGISVLMRRLLSPHWRGFAGLLITSPKHLTIYQRILPGHCSNIFLQYNAFYRGLS